MCRCYWPDVRLHNNSLFLRRDDFAYYIYRRYHFSAKELFRFVVGTKLRVNSLLDMAGVDHQHIVFNYIGMWQASSLEFLRS